MKRVRLVLAMALLAGFASSVSAQGATSVALSETKINKVITVKVGTKISLTLHSMYWDVASLSKYGPLVSNGAVVLNPTPPGPSAPQGCKIAGSGCGTKIWKFLANKAGTTTIRAIRTTCGEAMQCTPENGNFQVTLKVIK